MTWRSISWALAIALATASCEGAHNEGGSTTAVTTSDRPGTGGTSDEPPQTTPAPRPAIAAAPGQPGALPPQQTVRVVVVPATGVAQAEDGHGATVPANDPVFIELRGHIGGRALGPELEIGQLRFRDHSYPDPGVVRFTCADRALLTRGAEVALVYGTERTVIAASLEVP